MPKKTEVLVFPEYWKLYGLAEDGAELSARRAWNFGVLQTQRLYLPIVQENEKLLKELKDAFSALDDALGGNDADVESDEEERENYPVQYAARIISGIIQNMQKEKRRRTPRVPDAGDSVE